MNIIILGNGGHSKVIQEIIYAKQGYKVIAILDDRYEFISQINGKIYAPIAYLKTLITEDTKVIVAIGNNSVRKSITDQLILRTDQYVTVIHPTAVVSSTAMIGNGTVVMPGAYINAETVIGDHCIINTGAIIEHENSVGNFTHISPNATLTGNVSIGDGTHVGASTTVIPGITIGSWSIIGAGSTVIENIPSFSKAVGSPTRILRAKGNEKSEDKAVM